MKLLIIGASGKAGKEMVRHAIEKKIDTAALVRSPEKLEFDIATIEKDAGDIQRKDLAEFDVVINTLGFNPEHADLISKYGQVIIDAASNHQRLIFVGHAGTLLKDENADQPMYLSNSFPKDFKPVAEHHYKNLQALKDAQVNWTMMAPASFFDPDGKESRLITTGRDVRVKNNQGKSYISYKDFALAVINEVINQKYINAHVSTAGEKIDG